MYEVSMGAKKWGAKKRMIGSAAAFAAAAALIAGLFSADAAQADPYEDLQRCAQMSTTDAADDSIALCTSAIESGELATRNTAIAYYNRGNAYRRIGAYQRAAADFTEALRIWPELDQAWNNRGGVYARLCRKEDALADFRQAMAIDESWVRLYQQHLRDAGIEIGFVDGQYGPRTEAGLAQLIDAQCSEG